MELEEEVESESTAYREDELVARVLFWKMSYVEVWFSTSAFAEELTELFVKL